MKEPNLKESLRKWSNGLRHYFDLFSERRGKDNSKDNSGVTVSQHSQQRFQHRIVLCDFNAAVQKALEEEEKEGWELCAVLDRKSNTDYYRLFFKKPVD